MRVKDLCMSCMQEKGAVKICPRCGWNENTPPASPLHLPAATVLLDRYIVGRVLGQGSCGITYMGYDIVTEEILAIKEYLPAGLATRIPGTLEVAPGNDPEARQVFRDGFRRFTEEGEALTAFNHDAGIVSVRACLEANQTAYIIMKFIPGRTLLEYLTDPPQLLSFDEIMKMMIPVLGALSRVHRAGLLHRDVAPENIIITEDGKAWLIDFATARNTVAEKRHNPGSVLKDGYAACEQHYSLAAQGSWTDVYGMAATIYRAIAGQPPPESLARVHKDKIVVPSRLEIDIPDFAEAALLKALAVRANERYQRISEFANDLRRARSNEDESSPEKGEQSSHSNAPQPAHTHPQDQSEGLWGAQLAQYTAADSKALWGDLSEKYSAESDIHNSDCREVTAAPASQAMEPRPERAGLPEQAGQLEAGPAPPPSSSDPEKRGWSRLFTKRNLLIMLIMIGLGILVGLLFSLYKGYLAPDAATAVGISPCILASAGHRRL